MSTTAASLEPKERLEGLFGEVAELMGQRNAIDSRLVEIVAEIDRDELAGMTGARSINALVAWKTGMSERNAEVMVAVAQRLDDFPRCAEGMREGKLSLDQVGVIAEHAADGSDAHYSELALSATVSQLRTAINFVPRPQPKGKTEPRPQITRTEHGEHTTYRITLPRLEAATLDAALKSRHDALIADHPGDHTPFPTQTDAFMSLVHAGWDTDVAARPHGQHTTVIVHVDVDQPAALHLGPVLTDEQRRELLCDATCEVWFQRDGRPIGAGRSTRTISRRLRRALEHRDRHCAVPGCAATRGLHAHHIIHWEDGGPTDLDNLVLLCPHHHRLHHRGEIIITGPARRLVVTDADGDPLHGGSLAHPPSTPPPNVAPYKGPTGERAQWWWYNPFQPQPPPSPN
ncbi:HNH endonuclease signature motif containing protein [Mycolicibacterium cosmeticum]|uniref:HNH endonuclease signature motif containing protein n=1 Tax=Mycolicibacterium cosmeticum TaxID=258533 RepID=UPI0032048C2F